MLEQKPPLNHRHRGEAHLDQQTPSQSSGPWTSQPSVKVSLRVFPGVADHTGPSRADCAVVGNSLLSQGASPPPGKHAHECETGEEGVGIQASRKS